VISADQRQPLWRVCGVRSCRMQAGVTTTYLMCWCGTASICANNARYRWRRRRRGTRIRRCRAPVAGRGDLWAGATRAYASAYRGRRRAAGHPCAVRHAADHAGNGSGVRST